MNSVDVEETQVGIIQRRKEKRKALKKLKRKDTRKNLAISLRQREEALADDPEEQRRILLQEQEEREYLERERKAFEERERLWLQTIEENRTKALIEALNEEKVYSLQKRLYPGFLLKLISDGMILKDDLGEDEDCEYAEEGPAEIIWKGNEIIVKKKQIKVLKRLNDKVTVSVRLLLIYFFVAAIHLSRFYLKPWKLHCRRKMIDPRRIPSRHLSPHKKHSKTSHNKFLISEQSRFRLLFNHKPEQ